MSTILKALRRLEQEKSKGRDRPLTETVANAPEPRAPAKAKGPRLLVTIAATVALFAAGAAIWWAIARNASDAGNAPSEVAAAVAEAAPNAPERAVRPPTSPPRRAPGRVIPARPQQRRGVAVPGVPGAEAVAEPAADIAGELPAAALESDVAVVERPPPPPPAEVAPPNEPVLAAEPVAAPPATARKNKPGSSRPGAGALVPRPPATEVAAAQPAPERAIALARQSPPRPAMAPKPKPKPKPEPEPKPAVVAAAPVAKPPPAPSVFVQRTHWHPRAEERVAFVEFADRGETIELHEGDTIGSLVVKKIEPTGVEFLNGSATLRRRVGAR